MLRLWVRLRPAVGSVFCAGAMVVAALLMVVAVGVGAGGCASREPVHASLAPDPGPSRIISRPPHDSPHDRDPASQAAEESSTVRTAAQRELGPDIAATLPAKQESEQPPTTRRVAEPGAKALVESMLNALGRREIGSSGTTTIGLGQLHNQSHADADEFESFCERFAELLTREGRDWNVSFACDAPAAEYQLQGTAYLVTRHGFDMWELYPSLTPTTRDWSVWRSKQPVRVLRHPRPGQPQIMPTW